MGFYEKDIFKLTCLKCECEEAYNEALAVSLKVFHEKNLDIKNLSQKERFNITSELEKAVLEKKEKVKQRNILDGKNLEILNQKSARMKLPESINANDNYFDDKELSDFIQIMDEKLREIDFEDEYYSDELDAFLETGLKKSFH